MCSLQAVSLATSGATARHHHRRRGALAPAPRRATRTGASAWRNLAAAPCERAKRARRARTRAHMALRLWESRSGGLPGCLEAGGEGDQALGLALCKECHSAACAELAAPRPDRSLHEKGKGVSPTFPSLSPPQATSCTHSLALLTASPRQAATPAAAPIAHAALHPPPACLRRAESIPAASLSASQALCAAVSSSHQMGAHGRACSRATG